MSPLSVTFLKKMVFLSGPRQVGKTVFSHSLIDRYRDGHPSYFTRDNPRDREKLKAGDFVAKLGSLWFLTRSVSLSSGDLCLKANPKLTK